MQHTIDFTRQATQQLLAMPRNIAANIRAKIDLLAANPYAPNQNVRKLAGRDAFRLRVGDWRVVYRIEAGQLVIVVLTVKSRGSAYS
ncbi:MULTISPECIES: type II toxin-antitoxin system RelE family toxin [Cupriavidus]|uniref:Type II toxin-antitoxin system RelE/ParE family toxin n=1 Tax=Cupriavidus pauculus TaxID=82633 RepID=A0A3G8H8W0_9BURK|nr:MULTISPECIES: type II toxin-antitoxin system RelE/ParE family toxin [Cupriavidus]AZG16921.1 type II toxin-antitoxin system RelE/ParE family toxin [Cupriavidus pauculus]MDT6961829.1 type II toxin-antitoxin system RelE/ParE family toxin [Cupriavidus sp. SZY C1]